MPIYEFRCVTCSTRSTLFLRSISTKVSAGPCENCGGEHLARIFSRVSVLRGDEGIDFNESSLADLDENDPRSMARWIRKMSNDIGEPLDGEMQSELERMEAGEMPGDADGGGDDFTGVD